ncbi:MAG: hypothetical protein IJ711_09355 [Lachnospiraceae bacterium]|nr:hypothetical protein [Lachnospiraceae bacterium]
MNVRKSLILLTTVIIIAMTCLPSSAAGTLDRDYGNYPEKDGQAVAFVLNMDTNKCQTYNIDEKAVQNLSNLTKYVSKKSGNISSSSLTNYLLGTVTPKTSSYVITFYNLGVDKIDSISFSCYVSKYNGAPYTTYSKTLKKVKIGSTSVTWKLPKTNTVQEKLTMSGVSRDGSETMAFSCSAVRYNFAGGKYGTMQAYDGQKHHMPSTSVSPLSSYSGPCIRMITTDHKLTASYGNSVSAKKFREKEKSCIKAGKFLAAQQLGVTDVRKKFGPKYNAAINSMVAYTKMLGYKK